MVGTRTPATRRRSARFARRYAPVESSRRPALGCILAQGWSGRRPAEMNAVQAKPNESLSKGSDRTKLMPSESSSEVKFEIGHVLFIDIVGYSRLLLRGQTEQIQKLKDI